MTRGPDLSYFVFYKDFIKIKSKFVSCFKLVFCKKMFVIAIRLSTVIQNFGDVDIIDYIPRKYSLFS